MATEKSIEEVFALFPAYGDSDYIGEPLSKSDHSVQCAQLAEKAGADPHVVLGALFHDIGHLVGLAEGKEEMLRDGQSFGISDHGNIGALYLEAKGFPASVTQFPRGHVLAKKYLCYKNPAYFEKLSPASKQTLEFQGGPMTSDEATVFESNPDAALILKMRTWDEAAKIPNMKGMKDLEYYKAMARRVLLSL